MNGMIDFFYYLILLSLSFSVFIISSFMIKTIKENELFYFYKHFFLAFLIKEIIFAFFTIYEIEFLHLRLIIESFLISAFTICFYITLTKKKVFKDLLSIIIFMFFLTNLLFFYLKHIEHFDKITRFLTLVILLIYSIRLYGAKFSFKSSIIPVFFTANSIIAFYILIYGHFSFFFNSIFYTIHIVLVYWLIRNSYEIIDSRLKRKEWERDFFLQLFDDAGKSFTKTGDIDDILNNYLEKLLKITDGISGAIVLKSSQHILKPVAVHGIFPSAYKDFTSITVARAGMISEQFKAEDIKLGETYIGRVAENGKPLYIEYAETSKIIRQTAPDFFIIKSVIAVPLIFQKDILGVIILLNKKSERFTEDDFNISITFAKQVASVLNTLKMYKELLIKQKDEAFLQLAGDIQQSLLPHDSPTNSSTDFFAVSIAARGVGGDYYDFFNISKNITGFVMCDVAGKGMPAALVMVMIRTMLSLTVQNKLHANEILFKVNEALSGQVSQDRYATAFYFIFNSSAGVIEYSNAGHGPMLFYKASDKKITYLDAGEAPPIGIMKNINFERNQTSVSSGDILILYTDGITEAMNTKREMFGTERLEEIVKKYANERASIIGKNVIKAIDEFSGAAPQHDDETILIVKIN